MRIYEFWQAGRKRILLVRVLLLPSEGSLWAAAYDTHTAEWPSSQRRRLRNQNPGRQQGGAGKLEKQVSHSVPAPAYLTFLDLLLLPPVSKSGRLAELALVPLGD